MAKKKNNNKQKIETQENNQDKLKQEEEELEELIFIKDYTQKSDYTSTEILSALMSAKLFSVLEMEKTGINSRPSFTRKQLDEICKKHIGGK